MPHTEPETEPSEPPEMLALPDGRRIAFHRSAGSGPGIVFLGGLRSDMTGTKAVWIEAWARAAGRAFLRLDYTGHGASSGRFENGTVGGWAADAEAAVERLTEGPVVLVGSSMGGWIALILARRLGRVAGLVGIAAAPDFTEDGMWAGFSPAERAALASEGHVTLPSGYSDAPTIVTRRLIEDGRRHLVLREALAMPFPVRLLHGTEDADVPVGTALRLMEHADCADLRLTLVKGAGHRFSTPDCLVLIGAAVVEVSAAGSTR
ncbi:alpha/beta hydrolase [soil metagenome]